MFKVSSVVALFMLMIVTASCAVPTANHGSASSASPADIRLSPVPATHPTSSPIPTPTPTPTSTQLSTTSPAPKKAVAAISDNPSSLTIQHIVVVVEENHSYSQIVGNSDAPYMQSLIKRGVLFTDAHGVTHPSQPNYLALFSGSMQRITDDGCHKAIDSPNLASELFHAKLTFAGYSEDLPKAGFTGCSSKGYGRKHNPWAQFTNVPASANVPFSDFPNDFSKLPTVSFVIPNHQDDMHDGTVKQADQWLQTHLGGYVTWAQTHNSLLVVTWDEDDFAKENHIPMFIIGPDVTPGTYTAKVNHYNLLRTIEDIYGLRHLGESAKAASLSGIWKKG